VRLAFRALHGIAGQLQLAALQVLLQRGLRVLLHRLAVAVLELPGEQRRDHPPHRLEAAVQVHRAQQRLERVGEDRGPPEPAALQLALAQAQPVAEAQSGCDLGKRRLVHERGAKPREVAFGKLREALVEERGDGAVEQAVAEEFEALVVDGAVAAVGEGLPGEAGIGEGMADAALQLGEALGRGRAARRTAGHWDDAEPDEAVKSMQALMFDTIGTLTDQLADTTVSPPSFVISRSSGRTDFTSSMALRRSNEARISRTVPLRSPACSMAENIFFTEKYST
jgi:hypothetical protein